MSKPHPVLGYPSKTAAVLALRADGVSDREIARRIGIDVSSVSALACTARLRCSERGAGEKVLFRRSALDRLRPHAMKRRVTPEELCRRVIDIALENDLVDAILDDGVQA